MLYKEIAAAFKKAYSGYGRAIRMEHENPIPGEPFMSMKDAVDVSTKVHLELIKRPASSLALDRIKSHREDIRSCDWFISVTPEDQIEYKTWFRTKKRYPTTQELEWANKLSRRTYNELLDSIIDMVEDIEKPNEV